MVGVRSKWSVILAVLLCANVAFAKVSVRVNRKNIRENETFVLIIDKDGRSVANPGFEVLNKNFDVGKISSGMNIVSINGRIKATTQWAVRLTSKKSGKITIPAIQIGNETTRPMMVNITKEHVVAGQPKDVFFESTVSTKSPYVQQHILYTLRFYFRQPFIDAKSSLVMPRVNGKEMKLLEEPRRFLANKKGVDYQVYELQYAYTPQKSGAITISAPRFRGIMVVNQSGRLTYDAFAHNVEKQVIAKGRAIKLDVKPIPPSFAGKWWLPASAVTISESWSKPIDQLKTGEAVTRKITITARGVTESQLPSLSFNDQQGLNIYPDKPEVNSSIVDGKFISSAQYSIAYVPTVGRHFTVEKISVPWWDTKTNKAAIATLPSHQLVTKGVVLPVASPAKIAPATVSVQSVSQVNPTGANNHVSHRFLWTIMVPLMLSGWLFGAIALVRTRNKRPRDVQVNCERASAPYKASLKKLKAACGRNNVSDAHRLTVEVVQAYCPDQSILNLTRVANLFNDSRLTQLLSELNDQRYAGHDKQDWDGKTFYTCFAKHLKSATNKSHDEGNSLPELFLTQ